MAGADSPHTRTNCPPQIFHYSSNPLFLLRNGEDSVAQREQASFMTHAHLVWVSRTPEMFLVSPRLLHALRCASTTLHFECYAGEFRGAARHRRCDPFRPPSSSR